MEKTYYVVFAFQTKKETGIRAFDVTMQMKKRQKKMSTNNLKEMAEEIQRKFKYDDVVILNFLEVEP